MSIKESFKVAGYKYVAKMSKGEHLLECLDDGLREVWFCNKNHASYGLIFKNTHLEFARQASQYDLPYGHGIS